MDEPDWTLTPERTAAATAPILDRIRLSIARQVTERAVPLLSKFGISGPVSGTIAMLRNTMPDRRIDRSQVFSVFLYTPRTRVAESLEALVAAGLLVELDEVSLCLSARGRDLISDLYRASMQLVDERWSDHASLVASVGDLVQRAVTAATATGGPAFEVMAPPWEPEDGSPAMLLAERLTALRFHRFDAHAAAWQAAGLTVEEVQQLSSGPRRDAIEHETNLRAGAPYEPFSPSERFALCAGLGALPG